MTCLVECLGEVQDEDVSLFAMFHVTGYVILEFKKKGFKGSTLPEAMLEGIEYLVFFDMVHDVASDNVLRSLHQMQVMEMMAFKYLSCVPGPDVFMCVIYYNDWF